MKTGNEHLISVIIPVYNAEEYIKDTLDSVLNQTYKNIEIILVNDCTPDNSLVVINQYNDSKIKVVSLEKNGGVAHARNIGIMYANGEYVCFIDSDDVWTEDKIQRQLEYILEKDAEFCYTSYSLMDADKNEIKSKIEIPATTNYKKLLSENVIACSTVMVKKSVLHGNSFENVKHEDFVLWLKLAKQNIKMVGLNEVMMNYRKHLNSISDNKFKSARWRWNIYRNSEKLSLPYSIYCFIRYAIGGVLKHYL